MFRDRGHSSLWMYTEGSVSFNTPCIWFYEFEVTLFTCKESLVII